MQRMKQYDKPATYVTWQPGDGTSYTLVVIEDPHGGKRLWWQNGRSKRKNENASISHYWTDNGIGFADLRDLLARSMRLLPYDAEALTYCMYELGYCAAPRSARDVKVLTASGSWTAPRPLVAA